MPCLGRCTTSCLDCFNDNEESSRPTVASSDRQRSPNAQRPHTSSPAPDVAPRPYPTENSSRTASGVVRGSSSAGSSHVAGTAATRRATNISPSAATTFATERNKRCESEDLRERGEPCERVNPSEGDDASDRADPLTEGDPPLRDGPTGDLSERGDPLPRGDPCPWGDPLANFLPPVKGDILDRCDSSSGEDPPNDGSADVLNEGSSAKGAKSGDGSLELEDALLKGNSDGGPAAVACLLV